MCIVNSSKWKSALRWRALNDESGERTPLKLLISLMPGLFALTLHLFCLMVYYKLCSYTLYVP